MRLPLLLTASLALATHAADDNTHPTETYRVLQTLVAADDNSHPIETYHALQTLAAAGDADAMYQLASRLRRGDGIVQDLPRAMYWYEQSAAHCPEHDSPEHDCRGRAERAWGDLEDLSAFTEDDIADYETRAQAGDLCAMRTLANQYRHGINIGKNPGKARHWLEAQAAAGDTYAIITLSRELDTAAAIARLEKAGDDPAVLHALAIRHEQNRDYAKARELYEKAAALGERDASVDLAALYAHGHGVTQDYEKARQLLESADTRKAHFNLGIIHDAALGVPRNLEKAKAHYEKAADYAERYENYAILYGTGADPYIALGEFALGSLAAEAGDHASARDWYSRAASKGYPSAQYNLADHFHHAGDHISARYWLEQAAQRGHANAAHNLGVIYQDGLGVAKNPDIGKRYLALAKRLQPCASDQPAFLTHNPNGQCAAISGEKPPAGN